MKISLYLENYLLDTDENTSIAITLCWQYLEDPLTIAGDYSKTISVPGTLNNNSIFGNIWNIDRIVYDDDTIDFNTGVYFNPAKRVDAKIFFNNDLFKIGYVQLNKISRNNGRITYEVTFYSELCNVLHTLIDASLSALNFPGKLAHTINADAVRLNVNDAGPIITNAKTSLSDYVKYGLSIDGVPENFSADKWLTGTADNIKVTEIDNAGTEYDSAMLLQCASNRVRPYIKIAPLLDQIVIDYNANNETQLMWDDFYFFNNNNPYINNGVLAGKLYNTDEVSSTKSSFSIKNFSYSFTKTSEPQQIKFESSDYILGGQILDLSEFTVVPNIYLNALLSLSGTLNENEYNSAIANADYHSGRQFTSNMNIEFKLYLEKLDNDNVPTGEKHYFYMDPLFKNYGEHIPLNQIKDDYNCVITPYVFETDINKPTYDIAFKNCVFKTMQQTYDNGTYKLVPTYEQIYTNLNTMSLEEQYIDESIDYDDKIGVADSFPTKFTSGNIEPAKYRLMVKITKFPENFFIRNINLNSNYGDYTKSITPETLNLRLRFTKLTVNDIPYNGNPRFVFRNNQPYQQFIKNSDNNTLSEQMLINITTGISPGSTVTFTDMIDNETTQGDFLVNFSKLFGLVFDSDTLSKDKKIRIKTKNKYFEDYSILDWSDKIDYSQDFKKTPINFSNRFLKLSYKNSTSYYADKYSQIFDTSYGDQIIDTGYEFNSETSSLLPDNIFTQCVHVKGEGLFNGGPVPGYFSKDNKSRSLIDDYYSLMFWNQDQNDSYKQTMTIFDDSSYMHDDKIGGSEKMCYIDTSTYGGSNSIVTQRKIDLPAPNILRKNKYNEIFSYDLGYPRANFCDWTISDYPSSATIYSNFWNSYMLDFYNKNTSIITAYVYLTPIDIMNFSFKNFVRINDTLYHPNKIIDYNPLSNKPVQVELVKVNNLDAYTKSNRYFYDYSNITLKIIDTPATEITDVIVPTTNNIFTEYSGLVYKGKFISGQPFTQRFKYVGEYNYVMDKDIYYINDKGEQIDISDNFNDDTLTLEIKEPLNYDIQMTLTIIEDAVKYYNITLDKTHNASYTFIEPNAETSTIRQQATLKIKVDPTDETYRLEYYQIIMNNYDITGNVYDPFTHTITIDNVFGDINISFRYTATEDVLIPCLTNAENNTSDYIINTDLKMDSSLFGLEVLANSRYDYSGYVVSSATVNNKFRSFIKLKGTDADVTISIGNKANIFGDAVYDYSLNTNSAALLSKSEILYDGRIRLKHEKPNNVPANPVCIYDTTSYYITQKAIEIPQDLSTIRIFGTSDGLTAAKYTDFYYLQTYEGNSPKTRLIPMLHYKNDMYRAVLYDVSTKKYYEPQNANVNLSRGDIADNKEDIFVQYIGNQQEAIAAAQSCYFDTNISMSNANNYIENLEIEIVCTRTLNDIHTFVSWSNKSDAYFITNFRGMHEIISGPVERTFTNGIISTPDTDTITSAVRINYGQIFVENETNPRVLARDFSNIQLNEVKRISVRQNYEKLDTTFTLMFYSNDEQTSTAIQSSKVYYYPNMGTSTLSIFKDFHYHEEGRTNYSRPGMRIFDIILYNKEHNKVAELVPVLTYTGTTDKFVSDEGIKAPAGYEPGFKNLINGETYTRTQGVPTFGFNHKANI